MTRGSSSDERVELLGRYISSAVIPPSLLFHSSDIDKLHSIFPFLSRILILASDEDRGVVTFLLQDIGLKYDNTEIISIEQCISSARFGVRIILIPKQIDIPTTSAISNIIRFSVDLGEVILLGETSIVEAILNSIDDIRWSNEMTEGSVGLYVSSDAKYDQSCETDFQESVICEELDDLEDLR